jgi:hypothetical protein
MRGYRRASAQQFCSSATLSPPPKTVARHEMLRTARSYRTPAWGGAKAAGELSTVSTGRSAGPAWPWPRFEGPHRPLPHGPSQRKQGRCSLVEGSLGNDALNLDFIKQGDAGGTLGLYSVLSNLHNKVAKYLLEFHTSDYLGLGLPAIPESTKAAMYIKC